MRVLPHFGDELPNDNTSAIQESVRVTEHFRLDPRRNVTSMVYCQRPFPHRSSATLSAACHSHHGNIPLCSVEADAD